jgi:NAD(P)-dependent dehydrogenase (short-subunit alcohol dehydrogenase family)
LNIKNGSSPPKRNRVPHRRWIRYILLITSFHLHFPRIEEQRTNKITGIGSATAFALAKHGIQALTLTDINKNNLISTANALSKLYPGVEIETLKLNVQDEEAVESSVAAAVKRFGRIDLGVNIAGIGGEGKATHESSSADWNKVLDVNLNGVWRSQRALLRVMVGQE